MAYSKETFVFEEVLDASQLNQLSANIRDHVHGQDGVSDVDLALDASQLDGQDPSYYDDAPAATRMIFRTATAPVGWEQYTSVNDRVIMVRNTAGAQTSGGSWVVSGITASASTEGSHNHGGATQSHAVTINEMPAHNHGGGSHSHSVTVSGSVDVEVGGTLAANNETTPTGASGTIITTQGGGAGHTHGIPSEGSHTHTVTVSPNGAWRPRYVDMMVCVRSK